MLKNKKTKVSLATLIVLLILFIPFMGAGILSGDDTNASIANVDSYVRLRSRPTTQSDDLFHLTLGQRVKVLAEVAAIEGDQSGNDIWYQLTTVVGGVTYNGYVASEYVLKDATGTTTPADTAFEQSISGFPESYKPYLRTLHATYPNWVFHPENSGVTWERMLEAETKEGVSLIQNTTDSSWQSKTFTGVVDAPNWVNASRAIVAYYLDPRNSLNEKSIFSFADLNYVDNSIGEDKINKSLTGTFMEYPKQAKYGRNDSEIYYMQIFAMAANNAAPGDKGINPIFLTAHAIQEVGVNGSSSSTGNNPNRVYNFFNIGAYSSTISASRLGLDLAYNGLDPSFNETYDIPWNTPGLSIINGAKWIYNNYVSKGQDTLYYIRFNASPDRSYNLGTHQYMTATQSVVSESTRIYNTYKASGLINERIDFYIPVYNSMPDALSPLPTNENSNDELVTLLYNKFLGRTPSSEELRTWSTTLNTNATVGDVAAGILSSQEFVSKNLDDRTVITLLYEALLGRTPGNQEINNMRNIINEGYSRLWILQIIVNSQECSNHLSSYSVIIGGYSSTDLVDNNMSLKPLVASLYQNVLGRHYDAVGLRDWMYKLLSGQLSGPVVAAGFLTSPEFLGSSISNEEFIRRLYTSFLGREPDEAGFNYWMDLINQYYSREYLIMGFVNSPEFKAKCTSYGIGIDEYIASTTRQLTFNRDKATSFVNRLYLDILGREGDQEGLTNWVNALENGASGQDVVSFFVFSEEFRNKNIDNATYISILYSVFLNRAPDESGFNYWNSRLDGGATREEIFAGICYSQEFEVRCLDAGFVPYTGYVL